MNQLDRTSDWVRQWFLCKPRSVRDCMKKFGPQWPDWLPPGVHTGRDNMGYTFYWVPPTRASRPFEKKLATLDLTDIHPVAK